MDLLLHTVTDAEGTVLLSTYQTRWVCADSIRRVLWLKPYIKRYIPHVYAAAT